MLGEPESMDPELFVACSLRDLIPEDYILNKVDRVLDLSWLREEVGELYCADNGRPGIDPEAAVRLMPAGFFHGIVHDRKLMREARMHIGIRWFAGFALHESLPDHSSLTRVRQRWAPERFRRIFERTVAQCMAAGLVRGETVHIDATLIRADVSWESLTTEHADKVLEGNNALGESSDHDDKQKDKQDDDRSPRGRGRRAVQVRCAPRGGQVSARSSAARKGRTQRSGIHGVSFAAKRLPEMSAAPKLRDRIDRRADDRHRGGT